VVLALLCVGEMTSVADSAYDLRSPALLGERIPRVFGAPGVAGFDVNYCLSPCSGDDAVATLVHCDSGRVLRVFTDQPGLQLYTGNHFDGIPGKLGTNYGQHSGVALETQNYPDAIHHVSFVSSSLAASAASSGVARGRFGGFKPPLKNVKKISEDKIVENTQS